ncbi:MAG: Asp-tRNA(Asn)/Glu-tRNA(Gln) amidotransferase subunit GatA [Spirochaetia bacterium]
MTDLRLWNGIYNDHSAEKKYREAIEKKDEEINAFLHLDFDKFSPESIQGDSSSEEKPLRNVPFAVKDNISVKDFPLTCGSKMLEHFVSPYHATAVRNLLEAGSIPIGKTNLDEFGMGSTTDNSALKVTHNPWDRTRVCGGSSGGSAASVAAGMVPFSICSDTGGSVRQPASFCGVFGLKPTYGTVSRYGLVAYASSLEVIGVVADSVARTKNVFEAMRGRDPLDQSSVEHKAGGKQSGPLRVGVLSGDLGLSKPVRQVYQRSVENLKKIGFEVEPFDLPILDYAIPAYYTIATAEASANLARYAGIRYGYRTPNASDHKELVRLSREEGFGDEVKMRILLGTYVLRSGFQDQYYVKAQKIRTALNQELNKIFSRVDLLYMPVYPVYAFKRGDEGLSPFQQKLADKFTATANLAGIPAMSFPAGYEDGLPVGMQFMAPVFEEERIFSAVSQYEEAFPPQECPGKIKWE